MEFRKRGLQPPLVVGCCLCAVFVFLHCLSAERQAAAPLTLAALPEHSEPPQVLIPIVHQGEAPEALKHGSSERPVVEKERHHPEQARRLIQNEVVPRKTLKTKGKTDQQKESKHKRKIDKFVVSKRGSQERQALKDSVVKEQLLINDEKEMQKTVEAYIKNEKKNLRQERKVFKELVSASDQDDTVLVGELETKLQELAKMEETDTSQVDKVMSNELNKEAEFTDMLNKWENTEKHPGSKWSRKHKTDMHNQNGMEKKFQALDRSHSNVVKAQKKFLKKHLRFEHRLGRSREPASLHEIEHEIERGLAME